MKSHYQTVSAAQLDKKIHAGVVKEVDAYKDEIYALVEWDCFCQALACCFVTLEQMGWRKKRLSDFKEKLDDMCHVMYTGIMGRKITAADALQHIKEAYGIDLKDSQYLEEYEQDMKREKE